jgi:transposase
MSNGRKKGEGNTRNGNKYLSWAFVEVANFAMRFCAEAKRFYERKKARTNPIIAQGAGAQAGPRLFPYAEGAKTV